MIPTLATSDAERPERGSNGDNHAGPVVLDGGEENAGRGEAVGSSEPAEITILSSMKATEDATGRSVGVVSDGGELSSSSYPALNNASGTTRRRDGIQLYKSSSAPTIEGIGNNGRNRGQPEANERSLQEEEDNTEKAGSSAFSLDNSTVTPCPVAATSTRLDRSSTSCGIRRSRSFDRVVQQKSKVARPAVVASRVCRRRGIEDGGSDGRGEHALPGGGWAKGGIDYRTSPKSSSAHFAQEAAAAGGIEIGLVGESGRWYPGIGVIGGKDGECGVATGSMGNSGPPVLAMELLNDEGLKEAFAARGRHQKTPVLAR